MKQYSSPKVEVSAVQVEAGFSASNNTGTNKEAFKTILGFSSSPEEM